MKGSVGVRHTVPSKKGSKLVYGARLLSLSTVLIRGRSAPWFQGRFSFCTDFSENSRPAWELAVNYAKGFGAQLLILHVIDFLGHFDWPEKLLEILKETGDACDERLQLMAKEAQLAEDVKIYCRTGPAPIRSSS